MLLRRIARPAALGVAVASSFSVASFVSGLFGIGDMGNTNAPESFAEIPEMLSDGTEVTMGNYLGNVLYIVNVASE